MKIPLNQIKPSPRAVRKTWDEEALEQLAQSIKEHGLIVPIKVRPDGNGKYEIVYGHRRVKAMRRADIKETEAIVEGLGDTEVLVQALIENVQREDMNPIDVAKTLFGIQEETGWSQTEMARRGIMPRQTITNLMALLKESPKIQRLVERGRPGSGGGSHVPESKVTPSHIQMARESGLEQADREAVIEKAIAEGLTSEQTRRVADTIKAAPSEQAKKKVLEWKYSPTLHDPERLKARAKEYGAHDPIYQEKKPRADAEWKESPEVKDVIDSIKIIRSEHVPSWIKSTQKMSPEAKSYIARRTRELADDLISWADELEA